MQLPDSIALSQLVRALDTREQKTIAGLVLVFVREPARVREREWCAERLTEVAALARGLTDHPSAEEMLELKSWLTARGGLLLPTALSVFARAAADLAADPQMGPLTYARASAAVLAYFATPPPGGSVA